MNETERMCIDRILPTEVQEGPDVLRADTRRAVAEANKMWPNGTVLKIGFLNGSSAQHARVERWARQWTDHANLEFEFNAAQDGDIRIEFANDNRSWSWVGIEACLIAPNEATMHFGWELEEGTVLHEFGHAL
ncbi:MAG: hypothetical protein R3293_16225, partial [Candidatus Promineifilaceae bacterium]|nr:hypothetical protein [Candidatus Promineifilaceae bacterium]